MPGSSVWLQPSFPQATAESLLLLRWCDESICPAEPPGSTLSLCTSVSENLQQHRPLWDRKHWETVVFFVFFLMSAHIYPILPLCRLTGWCCIPEHLGTVLKGSPVDRPPGVHERWRQVWVSWDRSSVSFTWHCPLSFCCSWRQLTQETVKTGCQREGGPGFWLCWPHVSFTKLKAPLSKFKGKRLPVIIQIANQRPHSELAEDSRIELLSWCQLRTTMALVWFLGTGTWSYFICCVKTMRRAIITADPGPAISEMLASFLRSEGAYNTHCPPSNCFGPKGLNGEGA